jgi:glycosidase
MHPLALRCLLLAASLASPGAAATPPPPPPPTVARLAHAAPPQVFYFVLTDRFANGRTDNDRGHLEGGRARDGFDPTVISHYHGGDFAGLTARLDYLKGLGITAIWVTPPFTNKAVQSGTAGYHGYWITDFLRIDPHLGTNEEFSQFIAAAERRGIRVFLDIIVNHTADVIVPKGGATAYRAEADYPWRDAQGRVFDENAVAYNGLNDRDRFPPLSAEKSFAYVPEVAPAEAAIKNPAWLNDPTLYHNRGNTTFRGENSLHGDFVGLDDLFTEHPRVVDGMIEIFSHWLTAYKVAGYRLDTARHVNPEFWQAFVPAIHRAARAAGRGDFLLFGEVYNDEGDPSVLAEYSTTVPIDTSLDFAFFRGARYYLSRLEPAGTLSQVFRDDDYYTDHDSNVHVTPTFLGNHDAGRFGHFLKADNPKASDAQLLTLMKRGHELLFFARGQPVVYYGDEQGMTGTGGDMAARETMFASQAPHYRDLPLIGTTRTGADEKFDPTHPLYALISTLSRLRGEHSVFGRGAMIVRESGHPSVLAFSRVERDALVEYLVAFNAHRTAEATVTLPTSQAAGQTLRAIYRSGETLPASVSAADQGGVNLRLPPLGAAVYRADQPLQPLAAAPRLSLPLPAAGSTLAITSRTIDGQVFPTRHEVRAELQGGDGVGEVTFLVRRASRPNEYALAGVDDAPPYRVFWSPPSDYAPDDALTFVATFDDLRGGRVSAESGPVRFTAAGASPGIKGARVPQVVAAPAENVTVEEGKPLVLEATVEGTAPLLYQWQKDGRDLPGANSATLTLPACTARDAGRYHLRARNLAGTTLTAGTAVGVSPAPRL